MAIFLHNLQHFEQAGTLQLNSQVYLVILELNACFVMYCMGAIAVVEGRYNKSVGNVASADSCCINMPTKWRFATKYKPFAILQLPWQMVGMYGCNRTLSISRLE